MKYNYLIFLFFLLFATRPSYGSHMAGADISYEWVADNSQGSVYKVYVTVFRDCSGISRDPWVMLYGKNMCNGSSILGNVALSLTDTLLDGRPNGTEVGSFCPGNLTTCAHTNTTLTGYQEWRYEGHVTLPSRCTDWRIWIQITERNSSDNFSLGGHDLYLEAMINNIDAPTNKSPFFTVKPTPYVCVNEPFHYNHGSVDPEGDSLSFENTWPLESGGRPVPYVYGSTLNVNNPFPTANGYRVDPRTGQITYTPTMVGKYTTTIKVYEWRNGKVIGFVTRDIQTVVRPCTTQKPNMHILEPSIFGALYKDSVMYACADIPFRFCFNVKALNKASILLVTDNHRYSIPASSVSYTNSKSDSVVGCFFWRPKAADVGFKILTIVVRDSSCSLSPDVVDRSFAVPIVVRPAGKTYQRYTICPEQSVTLTPTYPGDIKWSSLAGSSVSSLSCVQCLSPVARPDTATRYVGIQDMGGGCINSDTIDVLVDRSNSIDLTPDGLIAICEPGTIQLAATGQGLAPLQNLSCGVAAGPPTSDVDSAIIYPSGASRNQNTLNAALTPFNGQNRTGRHQYLLNRNDLRGSGVYSGTLKGLSLYFLSSSASVTYNDVRIAVLCTKSDTLSPHLGFLPGATQVFSAGSVVIPASGGWVNFDFNTLYNRDTTRNLVIQICYTNTSIVPTAYTGWVASQNPATLYGEANIGNLCTVVPATQALMLERGLPLMQLNYYLAPANPFAYTWRSSKIAEFSPSGTVQNPSMYADKSVMVSVSTVGRNGCKVRDSVDVYVGGSASIPKDTTICIGHSFKVTAKSRFSKTYKWYEDEWNTPSTLDCNDCAAPLATPTRDVIYTLVTEDSVGCVDTFSMRVTVKVLGGEIYIHTQDTVINYGSELQLNATGGFRYEWTASDSVLSAYDIPNPIVKPEAPVVLRVTGYTEDGCKNYDSVYIDVDRRGKIFVPDAFTPNGDGKNDIFRVVNFSFQELLEFKVFNRWGAEIFTTKDGTQGWDGTYKGEPQEIGTYFYLIRVRFSDNTEQRFVGDVTLIR